MTVETGGGGMFDREKPEMTLAEARSWIRERRWDGTRCPCCDRYVKVYARKISSDQVRFMAELLREARHRLPSAPRHAIVDARRIEMLRGGDYSKVQLWDLVERESPGHWRITHKGIAFLHGRIRVPKYAYVFDGELLHYDSDQVSVHDCYGEHFDLTEALEQPRLAVR